MYRPLAVALAVGLLFAVAGCSQSPADQAASDMLNVLKDFKSEVGNIGDPKSREKFEEMTKRMEDAGQRLQQEVSKMSPEERKAFAEKWKPRFDELHNEGGGPQFPGF